MTINNIFYTISFFLTLIIGGCKTGNHIDKYGINLDSLKKLPDGFYAYRHGSTYFEDLHSEKYRLWYNLDYSGDIESIFKVEDFKTKGTDNRETISKYGIDTAESKMNMQEFINLSNKFKFGHIRIDRNNKISFSYKDGLAEQYVKAFNDSVKSTYLQKAGFKLLDNGWFENIDK